jgi:hypothetical protein
VLLQKGEKKRKKGISPAMVERNIKESTALEDSLSQPAEKGAGFLLWGWVIVTVLNLGMIITSLALFAP